MVCVMCQVGGWSRGIVRCGGGMPGGGMGHVVLRERCQSPGVSLSAVG